MPCSENPRLTLDELKRLYSYDPETGLFTRLVRTSHNTRAGEVAGSCTALGYIVLSAGGRRYLAHRLAWLYVHGVWPTVCDHKDGNPANNKIGNLRNVTQAINMQNQRCGKGASKVLGVSVKRGKWRARIKAGGTEYALGSFDSKDDAHRAYLEAKRRLHPGNTL